MTNTYGPNECTNFKPGSILKLFEETCIVDFLGKHECKETNIKNEFSNKHIDLIKT